MLLATVVLASLLRPGSLSLRLEAMSLPKLIPILAEKTSRKLEFAAELRDEVLIIAVKNVSAEDLLERVATATSATWLKLKDDKLVLTRQKDIEDKQRQEWVEDRLSDLKKAAANYQWTALPRDGAWTKQDAELLLTSLKEANVTSPITDGSQLQRREALHKQLVGGRLVARLLDNIDLRKVSESLPTERVVFCTRPTVAQSAFVRSIGRLLEQFMSEQRTFAEVASGLTNLPINVGERERDFYTVPLSAAVSEARLVATRRGQFWKLLLFSATGSLLTETDVHTPSVWNIGAEIDHSMLPFSSEKISLPPESLAFNLTLSPGQSGSLSKWKPADDAFRKQLLNPEHIDPLSFSATATVFQIVDRTKANYVGSIPDSLIFGANQIGNYAANTKLKLKDGWLSSKPSNFQDRSYRIPRKVLGEYARLVAQENVEGIEAKHCLARAGIKKLDVKGRIAFGYALALGAPISNGSTLVAAEIMGGLTGEQLRQLKLGGGIQFRDLPPQTRKRVDYLMTRDAEATLFEQREPCGPPQMANSTWNAEPTQSWPTGVPPDAILTLRFSTQPIAVNVDAKLRTSMLPVDLAFALAPSKKGEMSELLYEADHRLLLGESAKYDLRIVHGRLLTVGSIEGVSIPRDTKPKKLPELPEDFRKLVDDFIQRIGLDSPAMRRFWVR